MSHFELLTLESVCLKVTDGTHDSPKKLIDGFPLIKGKDISNGHINFDDCDFISEKDHLLIISRSHPEYGDTLFTNIGNSIGDCVYVNVQKEFSIKNVALFKPDRSKVNPRFLFYITSSGQFLGEVLAQKSGSAQPFVSLSSLRKQKINVPSIGIQKKIAAILSAYDDLIENNVKRINLLEEVAQITYEEWFVRMKFPGHETAQWDKETGLPEGWRRATCFDVMDVLSGGTPKTDNAEYWNGNINFYTPKDATNGIYTQPTEKKITADGLKTCNSKLYPKDTLFITARGTVGKLNLAHEPMAMNQSCYALRAKDGLSQYFLYCSVYKAIDAFKGAANGGVFDAIVVDTFKFLPFVKPSVDVVNAFTANVEPAFNIVFSLLKQNALLREAREILLPRLMTGVIDVDQVEVPEALLARVA